MTPYSVLDLSPINQGSDAAQSFRNSLDLARHAERWGFRRFWLAEHHGMPGIASAATAVLIGHVAGGTETIRVGAGGIMLPNHAPLVIAEQFGTLESLYPGRIDLGLGRAPGSDQLTARALRRDLMSDAREFPQVVQESRDLLPRGRRPGVPCRAVPGAGLERAAVDPWLEPLRRLTSWPLRSACRTRSHVALRARATDGRDRGLPRRFPAVAAPREALRDARLQRVRRGHRHGGALSSDVDAAGVRQLAERPTRAASAAARRLSRSRGTARARVASDSVLSCSAIGAPATVRRLAAEPSSSAPAPTS